MMLEFYISLETEKNKLMDMFCVDDLGASLDYRAKQYHFPKGLALKMHQKPRKEWDIELDEVLNTEYQKKSKKLRETLEFYKTYWKVNKFKYIPAIESFIGEKLPVYRVLLAHFLDGISNWSEPSIVISAYSYQAKNPLYHVYSLLYELILSQVFIQTRKIYSKGELNDKKLWMASELTAFSFLSTTFSEFSKVSGTGYPELDIYTKDFLNLLKKQKTLKKIQSHFLTIFKEE